MSSDRDCGTSLFCCRLATQLSQNNARVSQERTNEVNKRVPFHEAHALRQRKLRAEQLQEPGSTTVPNEHNSGGFVKQSISVLVDGCLGHLSRHLAVLLGRLALLVLCVRNETARSKCQHRQRQHRRTGRLACLFAPRRRAWWCCSAESWTTAGSGRTSSRPANTPPYNGQSR